jgi:2-keto-3-deoxy-L-rhamnonate aldolase RhmA
MRENALKARLASGGVSAGVIVPVAEPALVEVCAMAGFDHVLIDAEHGNISVAGCEALVRAAEAVGTTPIVRVPVNAPEAILRFLDTGAQGVLVPQVTTREDAERAVRAARYHPLGQRGLAGTRAADYGLRGSLTDYARRANEQLMVQALIEDARAIDHLPAILAVEGLDLIAIGPADLSQSLGHPGERDHPVVREAIAEIIRLGLAAGKVVGMNSPTGADAAFERVRGVRLTSVGVFGVLAQGARAYLAAAEGA